MPKGKTTTAKQPDGLIETLKARFDAHMHRHPGLDWTTVQARARHDTLAKLASGLEGDVRSSCDGPKVQKLAQAVTNLANTPVP